MSNALWQPKKERIEASNITAFMRRVCEAYKLEMSSYAELYDWSITHPDRFWQTLWSFCDIRCSKKWDTVVQDLDKMLGAKWFVGSQLNFAENLLRFKDDREALVFWSEAGTRRCLTYAQLNDQVTGLTNFLVQAGVRTGDRVAGFMPNMPETIIAMLAATSLGAIWSSCSPDFGVKGVIDRFGQIAPKVLFTVDGYTYNGKAIDLRDRVAQVLNQIDSIEKVVVVPFLSEKPELSGTKNVVLFSDCLKDHTEISFAQLPFDHPVYIMYSSGTTGAPKCIVHGAGGTLLQHLKELVLHTDLRREDRIFYFTTCGWMMWNWLVTSLATGATVLLYDGSPFHPDGNRLFDLAEQERMTVFGTSAKYISAVEKAGLRPKETHDLSSLRAMLSTGSPLLPESFDFVYRDIKQDLQLSSISGGTDIVSCFALGSPICPVYRSELQVRGLGMKVEVFDPDGNPLRNQRGELVCTMPFPSMPIYFWSDPKNEKYKSAYFDRYENVWCHGDWVELTEHDGLIMGGRSDTVLNPGGVRIGTSEIYRQVEQFDEVVDCLVIGQAWEGDERVILFVKLRPELSLSDELIERLKKSIRSEATPRHVPAKIIQVPDIPRTISGKIVELAVKNIVHGREVKNKDALANPEVLKYFENLEELKH